MDIQIIQNKIYEIRGQRVMLDFDLAALYQSYYQCVKSGCKRNIKRFPDDFMFQLSKGIRQLEITNCYIKLGRYSNPLMLLQSKD